MKLVISNPVAGATKTIDIDDEKKLRVFFDAKLAQEVAVDGLGDDFKGYVMKIVGGSDKQGFPMKQGVLSTGRVRLLLPRGATQFQAWRGRLGERRKKTVRGCIVASDIAALNLIVVKKGEKDIPGLTDDVKEVLRGPKRASKIRKFFNLTKEDDVRKYVIKHKVKKGKKGTERMKGPRIQRLVTPQRLHNKKRILAAVIERKIKKTEDKQRYEALLKLKAQRALETKKKAVEARKKQKEKKQQKKEEKTTKPVEKVEKQPEKKQEKQPEKKQEKKQEKKEKQPEKKQEQPKMTEVKKEPKQKKTKKEKKKQPEQKKEQKQ